MQFVINPLTNRPVKIGSRKYRMLVRNQIITEQLKHQPERKATPIRKTPDSDDDFEKVMKDLKITEDDFVKISEFIGTLQDKNTVNS